VGRGAPATLRAIGAPDIVVDSDLLTEKSLLRLRGGGQFSGTALDTRRFKVRVRARSADGKCKRRRAVTCGEDWRPVPYPPRFSLLQVILQPRQTTPCGSRPGTLTFELLEG